MHKVEKKSRCPIYLITLIIIINKNLVYSNEIHIAVASNFASTIKNIANAYQLKTKNKVFISYGSTGMHFLQIKNGAPFDIFFAADVRRPKLLESLGLAQSNSRFTYAIGRIVLWVPNKNNLNPEWDILISNQKKSKIAIANPRLAPYGQAAKEIMESLGMWEKVKNNVIRGNDINQTYNFIVSGNADMGFISYSQVKSNNEISISSILEPKKNLYTKIEQQAVLLKNNETAKDFIRFFKSSEVNKIIKENGYEIP